MDLGHQLNQSQRLEQNLSPQTLQVIKILQTNAIELETAVKNEIETNPLLELDENSEEMTESLDSAENGNEDTSQESDEIGNESDMDFERGTLEDSADTNYDILDNTSAEDWVKRLNDGADNTDAPFKDLNVPDPDADWDNPQKDREPSLQDRLYNQLREWNGTRELLEQLNESGCSESRFRELVQYLIDSLDENGYLQPADEVAMTKVLMDNDRFVVEIEKVLRNEISLENASLPVAEAIHVLRNFKPRGIGARNMQESFLLQAQALDDFPELGIEILKNHYQDLKELRYAKIAKDLSVSTVAVQQVVASLSRLAPHPGFQISNSASHVRAPDLRVYRKFDKDLDKYEYKVECLRDSVRKNLKINRTYADMLKRKDLDKESRAYIQENLMKAQDFIKSVDIRFSTMEKVMRAIVKKQPEFFKKGPAYLKPMILQDVADDVEVKRDLSTVSRVTNGKYVETPYGVYELKDFFTSGVSQGAEGDGEVVGSAQIINAVKELVDAEDKKKPLSDQAIADILFKEQGIKVSRRAVSKYREEKLRILPARLRKQV